MRTEATRPVDAVLSLLASMAGHRSNCRSRRDTSHRETAFGARLQPAVNRAGADGVGSGRQGRESIDRGDQTNMSMDANETPLAPDSSRVANQEVMRGLLLGNPHWLRGDPQLLSDLALRLDAANIVDFGPVPLSRVSAPHQRKSSPPTRLQTMPPPTSPAQ